MEPVEHHLQHMQQRSLSVNTIMRRRLLLARTEDALRKPLLEATSADLNAWRATLHQDAGTVCGMLSGLRAYYRWALAEELIPSDPMRKVVSPRTPRRMPRPIPESELELALACAPYRIRPWLYLAAFCGLRAQEIARLQVSDLCLTGNEPYVSVSAEAAKGGKPRIVPLGQQPLGALRTHGVPAKGFVFPRYDGRPGGNAPWTISTRSNVYLHGLGLPYSIHTLRHRYASRMYALSLDLRMVQQVLGHASPSTTAAYVAFSQQSAIAAARALDVA